MKRLLIPVGLLFVSVVLLPIHAEAAMECVVEPFDVTMRQGEHKTIEVKWASDNLFNLYEVTVGNLPLSVEGGFSKSDVVRSSGSVKRLPLILQAKPDAQTGSFMVSIIYKYADGADSANTKESVCQFNLNVLKNTKAYNYPSIQENVSKSVSNGVVPNSKLSVSTTTSVGQIISRLSRGYKGEQVKLLQDLLKKLGFFPKEEESTGYFGPITENAVKLFQTSKNIESVGIVGPKTRKILEELSTSGL